MTAGVAIRIALIVFVTSILQLSAFSVVTIGGGAPDALLVLIASIAFLRGSITGAVAGFAAGLIVDVAMLGTLGVTSLLLALVGYWAGRYGETTGRDRIHAPLLTALAATTFFVLGGYALQEMLGEAVTARQVLVVLPAGLIWNGLLAYPLIALSRRLVGTTERIERAREVELLV